MLMKLLIQLLMRVLIDTHTHAQHQNLRLAPASLTTRDRDTD